MSLSIQERLKDLRVERGLTLEQLAEQTNLSKSALGSYEADDFKDISHYFSSRVHQDIDTIMEDMRQAHRGRSVSAPKKSIKIISPIIG